jgi:hypothetical protein
LQLRRDISNVALNLVYGPYQRALEVEGIALPCRRYNS